MTTHEMPFAARSQRDVRKLLADRGTIVRRWETPELMVSWVRMEPWRVCRTRIDQLEKRALRKMRAAPEMQAVFAEVFESGVAL